MRAHLLRLVSPIARIDRTRLHTSATSFFYEVEKSGYKKIFDPKVEEPSLSERVWSFKDQIKLFYQEQREMFKQNDLPTDLEDLHVIWKFNEGQQSRQQWVVTCDSDYNQGYSTANLDISPTGTGIFHGTINPEPPKDGTVVRAGYSNMTAIQKQKSFWRRVPYVWVGYNTLVLRVRGDGRTYTLNILCKGQYDLTQYDLYFFPLYTRGGPYWQDVEVPFAKFAFTYKGFLQDVQYHMSLTNITNFGITIADKINAQFKLEIDYIGVKYDMKYNEEFAYETYSTTHLRW